MAGSERTIRIRFSATWAELTAGTKAAEKALKSFQDKIDRTGSAVVKHAASFARFAVKIAVVVFALQSLSAVVSGIVAALPALGLLPGAVAALGAAAVTAKLGMDGITKAFDRLTPTLDTLKANVSATFEKGLYPAVTNLRKLLPKLTDGLQGIASQLSTVATGFTEWLKAPAQVDDLNTIMGASRTVVGNLGKALKPLAAAFLDVAAVGSQMFAGLTKGAGAAAQRFADFVSQARQTGQLKKWIQGGINAIKSLGGLLKDLWGIVSGVFKGISSGTSSMTGAIGGALKALNKFINSAKGQKILQQLGKVLGIIADTVRKVLTAALENLAPILPPLVSAFGSLAKQVSGFLIPALKFLGPILTSIATFIKDNITWIGPLIIAISGLFAAIRVLNVVLTAMRLLVATNPFVLLAAAVVAIVTVIITYWTPISQFFIDLWNTIKSALAAAWTWIANLATTVWSAVASFFTGVWNGIKSVALTVWNAIKTGLSATWNGIKTAASAVWGAIKTVIINPITTVVDWLKSTWKHVSDVLGQIWNTIASAAGAVWGAITGVIKGAVNIVIGIINTFIGGINLLLKAYNKVASLVPFLSNAKISLIPTIPKLAEGGVVPARRGGMLAQIGEGGQPEAVAPLDTLTAMIRDAVASVGNGQAPTEVRVYIGDQELKGIVRTEVTESNRQLARKVTAGTGAGR